MILNEENEKKDWIVAILNIYPLPLQNVRMAQSIKLTGSAVLCTAYSLLAETNASSVPGDPPSTSTG